VRAGAARSRAQRALVMGFAIGLTALSPDTQRRVGRDAWLLTAWWIVVGVACSALLLEIVGIRSPLWRYPLTAIAMYAIGVVVGMRIWLALFSRAARLRPDRLRGATDEERRRDPLPLARPGVVAAFVFGPAFVVFVLELLWLFDVGRAILVTVFIGLAVAAFVGWACSRLPAGLGSEAVMAEMAMQFVFGRSFGRSVLPPQPPGGCWPLIVRETWAQGLSFLVLSAAIGGVIAVAHPAAVSLRDLLP
jgi:hypothetical protein